MASNVTLDSLTLQESELIMRMRAEALDPAAENRKRPSHVLSPPQQPAGKRTNSFSLNRNDFPNLVRREETAPVTATPVCSAPVPKPNNNKRKRKPHSAQNPQNAASGISNVNKNNNINNGEQSEKISEFDTLEREFNLLNFTKTEDYNVLTGDSSIPIPVDPTAKIDFLMRRTTVLYNSFLQLIENIEKQAEIASRAFKLGKSFEIRAAAPQANNASVRPHQSYADVVGKIKDDNRKAETKSFFEQDLNLRNRSFYIKNAALVIPPNKLDEINKGLNNQRPNVNSLPVAEIFKSQLYSFLQKRACDIHGDASNLLPNSVISAIEKVNLFKVKNSAGSLGATVTCTSVTIRETIVRLLRQKVQGTSVPAVDARIRSRPGTFNINPAISLVNKSLYELKIAGSTAAFKTEISWHNNKRTPLIGVAVKATPNERFPYPRVALVDNFFNIDKLKEHKWQTTLYKLLIDAGVPVSAYTDMFNKSESTFISILDSYINGPKKPDSTRPAPNNGQHGTL